MSRGEFDPGHDDIDEENKVKINYLIDVLADKEKLKLEIHGKFHPVKDREKLRDMAYESLLISMMGDEEGRTKEAFDGLSTEERTALIESAYASAKFPKPRDEAGKEKEISLPEKEKLLITALVIDDRQLDTLARNRSRMIRDYMANSKKIDPLRVFLTEPDPVSKEEADVPRVKTLFVLK